MRSLRVASPPEYTLEMSLPALLRRALPAPVECLPEAETEVALVAMDNDAESRELVGVVV